MSDKNKEITNEELQQAQGGVGGIKDLHDRPGTDPVPQQRAQGFGKVQMSGGELGEGELRQVKGGVGGIKDLHDRPGTDPVPQQRAKGFGKVQMGGGELGEGELRQVKGGTALPLAGGEPKSTSRRDGSRDLGECGPQPGLGGDNKDLGPDPLQPKT
jgi:hypothetical protein